MTTFFLRTAVLFLTFFLLNQAAIVAQDSDMTNRAKVRAPEFTGGKGWLNTDKPLSIAALKGKFVLLDFWTYGCINCIHIIPELKKLEAKYEKNLVVIGVHSAKFENEGETENIRKVILRYGIEHPVINDADYKIWEAYAIRAWPGLVLIDPDGYIIDTWFGEGHFAEIEENIVQTIGDFRKSGKLNEEPLQLHARTRQGRRTAARISRQGFG